MQKLILKGKNYCLFEDILENRVGLGKGQFLILSCFHFSWLYEGAEAIVISFILPIVKKEWQLTQNEISFAGSIIFLGWCLGSIFCGKMSDQHGRKRTMIWASIIQFIAGFFSAFSQNYYQFLILRALFGFSNGIVSPLTSCYTTELVPETQRAKFFIHLNNIFVLGEIIVIFLAILFLDNLQEGNWRALLFCSSMPALAALYLSFNYLIESPRYRLCCTNNKLYEVYEMLNYMGQMNNKNFQQLKDIEKEQLLVWAEASYKRQKDKIGSIAQLFKGDDLPVTINLMVMWFSISFIYYGMMLMLPIILIEYQEQNDQKYVSFLGIFLSAFVEFPSNFTAYYTIDNPKYGRKNSMFLSYLFCCLFCFITYQLENSGFLFFLLIGCVKFCLSYIFCIIYPFTAEVYITALRTTGLGLNSAVSRVGGILMPWISFYFFRFGHSGPFLGFSIVSGISAFVIHFIKFDTVNTHLDNYHRNDQEIVMNLINNNQ